MSASAAILAPVPTAKEIIHDLARRHGIRYERADTDDWAEAVSRVAGDDVDLDETEWLLVALGRAEIMPTSTTRCCMLATSPSGTAARRDLRRLR